MKLKNLLEIDDGRIQRSSDIQVFLEWSRMLTTPRKGFWNKLWGVIKREPYILTNLLRFKCINSKSGSTYSVFIELDPKKTFNELLKSDIRIFCSCSDFKYRSAYYLNSKDNLFKTSSIEDHLGIAITEKPRVVNTTGMCKHLYATVGWMKKNFNKLDLYY